MFDWKVLASRAVIDFLSFSSGMGVCIACN